MNFVETRTRKWWERLVFAFQEVAALRLVRPHVTVPVPFVLDAVGQYFIMTGLRLYVVSRWARYFSKMQPDKVARVREPLSEFVHQLRAKRSPTNIINLNKNKNKYNNLSN